MEVNEILNEITLFGERCKDKEAIKLLQFYEPLALEKDSRGYLVGFSGGKDSLVLRQLFKEAGVQHYCVYNITGLDPPELVYFKRKKFDEFISEGTACYNIMYKRNIIKQMEAHGTPPTRLIRYCCEELKERKPPEYRGCVLSFGVRKFESRNRALRRDELEIGRELYSFDNSEKRRQFEICYANNPIGEIRVNPLAYWTDAEIWEFIHDRKLDYCCLYDEGFTRLGCIGCPMAGKKRVHEFQRYPGFEKIWRRGFDLMWKKREERILQGKVYKIEFANVDEYWDWWMELTPKRDAEIAEQLSLDMENELEVNDFER